MTYDHFDREPLLENYDQSSSVVAKLKQPLKGTFVDDLYQKGKAQQRAHRLAEIGFENGRVMPRGSPHRPCFCCLLRQRLGREGINPYL